MFLGFVCQLTRGTKSGMMTRMMTMPGEGVMRPAAGCSRLTRGIRMAFCVVPRPSNPEGGRALLSHDTIRVQICYLVRQKRELHAVSLYMLTDYVPNGMTTESRVEPLVVLSGLRRWSVPACCDVSGDFILWLPSDHYMYSIPTSPP